MSALAGQTALITGAAKGIGLAIAEECLRAGARVVMTDKDAEEVARMARQLGEKFGIKTLPLPIDVTEMRSVDEGVAESVRVFGKLDVLINNAGIHCERIGEPSSPEQFSRCYDVNLVGVWRMSQAVLPHFKVLGAGRIVNVASINGRIPWADTPAYSASKAALINLTRALAMTLGQYNINVNAVCPGGMLTAMAGQFTDQPQAFEQELIRPRLLKHPLLPEDIGRVVVFLASSDARMITGQALNVDGGEVLS